MKKLILGGFSIILLLAIAYYVYSLYFAERVSPPDVAQYSSKGIDLRIDYSRPFKKGRLIFGPESEGALQPYGIYWRLGANEATKFTVSKPVSIKGNRLEAGSYSMYAIPGENTWTIGFNNESDRWGYSEPDYNNDVFRIEITPQKMSSIVEQLEILFEASDVHLTEILIRWDNVELRIPVDEG